VDLSTLYDKNDRIQQKLDMSGWCRINNQHLFFSSCHTSAEALNTSISSVHGDLRSCDCFFTTLPIPCSVPLYGIFPLYTLDRCC
jgi:hypothetical protein